MKRRSIVFLAVLVIILLSPVLYWLTGIDQSAPGLSAEVSHRPDGTLVSSPKAEALHRLTLPMRIERLLIYPLLLFCFQFSGGSLRLRRWLDQGMRPLFSGQARGLLLRIARGLGGMGRLIPYAWRQRVAGGDLLVIFLFVLILEVALFLLYLPFNFYSGFVLAHQFGLSTQAASGWATDQIKSLLIDLVMSGLGWTGFYGLMRLMPRRWPIPAGAIMICLSAILVLITPILITPLFYEVRALNDPALRARILALADRAGMHVNQVYVINASAKTTEVNAYFTGFGGAQRVVLYDTLLADYTPDQVEVVLAHEMGHWHYRHVLLGLLGGGAAGWIGLFALRWLLNHTWRRLGMSGPADVAGLPYVMAVIAVVMLLSLPVENGLSRYAERQADCFALTVSQPVLPAPVGAAPWPAWRSQDGRVAGTGATGAPQVFIGLFEKFAVQNLSMVDVPTWEKLIFYTHPPIAARIRMAENFERSGGKQCLATGRVQASRQAIAVSKGS
jgi:STE24 endopeptidase